MVTVGSISLKKKNKYLFIIFLLYTTTINMKYSNKDVNEVWVCSFNSRGFKTNIVLMLTSSSFFFLFYISTWHFQFHRLKSKRTIYWCCGDGPLVVTKLLISCEFKDILDFKAILMSGYIYLGLQILVIASATLSCISTRAQTNKQKKAPLSDLNGPCIDTLSGCFLSLWLVSV